jgi:hypothetical protein
MILIFKDHLVKQWESDYLIFIVIEAILDFNFNFHNIIISCNCFHAHSIDHCF